MKRTHIFCVETKFGYLVADVVRNYLKRAEEEGDQSRFIVLSANRNFANFNTAAWDHIAGVENLPPKSHRFSWRYFSSLVKGIRSVCMAQNLELANMDRDTEVHIYVQTVHKFLSNFMYFYTKRTTNVHFHLIQDGLGVYSFHRSFIRQFTYQVLAWLFARMHHFRYHLYGGHVLGMNQSGIERLYLLYSQYLAETQGLAARYGLDLIFLSQSFEGYLRTLEPRGKTAVAAPRISGTLFLGFEGFIDVYSQKYYSGLLKSIFHELGKSGVQEVYYLPHPAMRPTARPYVEGLLENLAEQHGIRLQMAENTAMPLEIKLVSLYEKLGFTGIRGVRSSGLLSIASLYPGQFDLHCYTPAKMTRKKNFLRFEHLGIRETII